MKIECCGCKEEFDVPEGKGYNRVICPFCEAPNDLRKPSFFNRSADKESGEQGELKPSIVNCDPSHPLAPQMTIIASCTLIITLIIIIYMAMDFVDRYQLSRELKNFKEELNKINTELSPELDKSMRQLQQSLNKFIKP